MPSGKTHDQITWICLPFIIILSLIITKQFILTFLVAIGFVFSGLMFGPDLDIYSVQFQRWGFLKFIWLPYQKGLKHRSFFSHGFIIGTIIRILYLTLILFIIAIMVISIVQLIFGFPWHWQKFIINSYQAVKINYWSEILSLFIGLELGAMSHYLADNIRSQWKAKNKQKFKKKATIKRKRKTTKIKK